MKRNMDVKLLKRRALAIVLAVMTVVSTMSSSITSVAAELDSLPVESTELNQSPEVLPDESMEGEQPVEPVASVNLADVVVTPGSVFADTDDVEKTFNVTNNLPEGFDGSVSYATTDEAIATVNETGAVTLQSKSGRCEIVVTIIKDEQQIERRVPVCVIESKFPWPQANEYTGEAIEKVVELTCGEVTLEEDKDYTLSYTNNIEVTTDDSKAQVEITGIGDYEGYQFARTFEIALPEEDNMAMYNTFSTFAAVAPLADDPKDISVDVDVQLEKYTWPYTGDQIKPAVKFYDLDGNLMASDFAEKNCDISYANNINAGTATVTIRGKGDYAGVRTEQFSISKLSITKCNIAVDDGDTHIYTGEPYEPTFTLTYNGNVLVAGEDFNYEYRNNDDIGQMTIHIEGKKNFKGSLDKAINLIGDFEQDAEVVIGGRSATRQNGYATKYSTPYTGTAKEPYVEISVGGVTLDEDEYLVDYDTDENGEAINHTNAGVVKVRIIGQKKYAGKMIVATYTIAPRPLSGCVFAIELKDREYSGQPITIDGETFSLKRGSTPLAYGEDGDYVLEYENNVNAGTATVKAVGVNNYSGYVQQTFTISPKDLTSLTNVTIQGVTDKTFTGEPITFPEAKVTYEDENGAVKELSLEDYTLSYSDSVNTDKSVKIGPATVKATGKGNYKGSISKTFEILPKTFEGLTFTVAGRTITCESSHKQPDGSYEMESGYTVVYNGLAQNPTVVIKDGTQDLAYHGVNYDIKNNINAGRAYVDVTGTSPYTDQKAKVYFTIEPKEFGDNISISSISKQAYTGIGVEPKPVVKDGTTTLVEGTDYTLSYENNINAAPADSANPPTVIIEGCGNYRGRKTATFTIGENLAAATSEMLTTNTKEGTDSYLVPYLGTNRPKFALKLGALTIDASNYDVSYLPAGDANSGNTIQVTCTGKKGYYGTKVLFYTVKQAELGSFAITNKDDAKDSGFNYTYSDRSISVNLEVKYTIDGQDIFLTKDVDYKISGDDLTDSDIKGTVGTHTIKLTGIGNYTGTQDVTYTVTKGNISAARYSVADIPEQTYTGYAIKPNVIITDTKTGRQLQVGTDYEVTGYSNNVSIGEGVAKISIAGINSYEGARDVYFDIVQRNIAEDTITIAPIENQIYTGSSIEPNSLLTVYYEGNPLSSTDYDVTYTQNVNLGYANVTITGKNNYRGTKTFDKAFKIVGNICDDAKFDIEGVTQDKEFPLNDEGEIDTSNITVKYKGQDTQVDGSNFKITQVNCTTPGVGQIKIEGQNGCYGSKTFDIKVTCNLATNKRVRVENVRESYDYTSGQIKPVPVVIYEATNGKVVLIEGVDYQVVYGDGTENANKDVGTGTVIIASEPTSYYKSQKAETFKIVYNLDTAMVTGIPTSYNYDGNPAEPIPVVSCKGTTLRQSIDYDVSYASNTVAGEGKVIITPHEPSNTIGRREITFKINKASIAGAIVTYDGADSTSIHDKDYIAEDIKPSVKVVYNGATLVAGKDYSVSYENNRNAGQATVTVTGLGNYSGTKTQNFVIKPWNIGSDVVAEVADGEFAGGEEVKPLAYLIYKGQSLTEGEDFDYVAEFTNNTQVTTTATVTFIGKNNFTGTLVKTFEIRAMDLGSGSINISQTEVPYTGNVISLATVKSAITVTCPIGQGRTHTLRDSEFDVTCDREIKNAGTYTIVVNGKNGFTGSLELSLTVTPKDMEDASIVVEDIPNQPYTDGSAVRPTVSVKDTGVVLRENTDYTVSYRDNAQSGKATVVITGINNYAGSREVYFYIGDSIAGRCEIALQQGRIVYNGTQQTPIINTVTLDGSTRLQEGVDYALATADENGFTYDYTNAGDKVLHIKGIGKYYGESTITYKIYPKVAQPEKIRIELDMPVNEEGQYADYYNGSAIEPAVRVYDEEISDVTWMRTEDYTVTYKNNVNVGKADVEVALKENYVPGTVKGVQFVIAKKSIEDAMVVLDENRIHYTGEEITPAVKVMTLDGTEIPADAYDVTYEDNICAGPAKVTVTAKLESNYCGTLSADFIIYASLADEADTTISEIGTQFYTESMGELPRPVPEIVCGGKKLIIGEDVDVTYNYVDGDKTKGKIFIFSKKEDYYTDAAERQYDIGVDTDSLVIENYADAYVYNGMPIKPVFEVKTPSGMPLTYHPEEIVYTNQTPSGTVVGDVVNAGTITAEIPLYLDGSPIIINGQQACAKAVYKIVPKAITACRIVSLNSDTYTGYQLTPPVSILYNDLELVSGRDYAITYRDNINPGVASIDLVGKGNYTGTTTLHFTIKSANMVNLTATPASATSIRLDWNKGGKVSGYQIYSTDGSILYGATTATTFTVGGLAPATSYSFKVRSFVTVAGATTFGEFKMVSANTLVAAVPIQASSPRKGQATVAWGTNTPVDGYDIYRSEMANERYSKVASIPSNRASYTDRGLVSGKTYYYMVRAYKKINGQYQYGAYTVVQVTVK